MELAVADAETISAHDGMAGTPTEETWQPNSNRVSYGKSLSRQHGTDGRPSNCQADLADDSGSWAHVDLCGG